MVDGKSVSSEFAVHVVSYERPVAGRGGSWRRDVLLKTVRGEFVTITQRAHAIDLHDLFFPEVDSVEEVKKIRAVQKKFSALVREDMAHRATRHAL